MALFLPEHSTFFMELLEDSRSGESDLEGFEEDDVEEAEANLARTLPSNNTNNFLIENWKEGDWPSLDLAFTAQPCLSPEAKNKLPDDNQPEDFVDLFLTNEDFMSMAEETDRYVLLK